MMKMVVVRLFIQPPEPRVGGGDGRWSRYPTSYTAKMPLFTGPAVVVHSIRLSEKRFEKRARRLKNGVDFPRYFGHDTWCHGIPNSWERRTAASLDLNGESILDEHHPLSGVELNATFPFGYACHVGQAENSLPVRFRVVDRWQKTVFPQDQG